MIVIGASLGGMRALMSILEAMPVDFPVPIAAALHRHKESDDSLAEFLQMHSKLPIREVVDKEPVQAGHVFIAPPDYHLFVESDYFSLSTDDLVQYARPSIDVLFESAADTLGEEVIGVILTGANQDGAKGAVRIKSHGGLVIVQDPETAECPIMPAAAIAMAPVDHVVALPAIGPLLLQLTNRSAT